MSRRLAVVLAAALLVPVALPVASAYPIPEGPFFLVTLLVVTVMVRAAGEVNGLPGQIDGCPAVEGYERAAECLRAEAEEALGAGPGCPR